MISPGSLCVRSANRNYLKLFVSHNYVFEVYIGEHEQRLIRYSDESVAGFFKCARLQTSSMWTKIS